MTAFAWAMLMALLLGVAFVSEAIHTATYHNRLGKHVERELQSDAARAVLAQAKAQQRSLPAAEPTSPYRRSLPAVQDPVDEAMKALDHLTPQQRAQVATRIISEFLETPRKTK